MWLYHPKLQKYENAMPYYTEIIKSRRKMTRVNKIQVRPSPKLLEKGEKLGPQLSFPWSGPGLGRGDK
jgi:hypothetical protein